MIKIREYFDTSALVIMVVTLVLFIAALYFTGFTHALLLETGVFLVSVKLILMTYKNKITSDNLLKELAEIRAMLDSLHTKFDTHK